MSFLVAFFFRESGQVCDHEPGFVIGVRKSGAKAIPKDDKQLTNSAIYVPYTE